MPNVLIIDDEQSICWGLKTLCQSMGHEATTAASAEAGLRLIEGLAPRLVMLDVRLPGIDGISAMEGLWRLAPNARIIVMTAFGDMETAVRAVRHGAFEYLLKPFDLAEVRGAIERAVRADQPAAPAGPAPGGPGMIGQTPAMQALYKRIALAAASDANVLLQGESGVGKELAAQAIHRHSDRAAAPFVAVNVASLNPSVAESELFGHVEGSFTGAGRTRQGLMARANGGTLFLDEVADIPLALQVKLLRAIEQGEVLPLGADAPVSTRFRIITASHQNLLTNVRLGRFRHDLYYRIAAFEIAIPPLRERVDDIPLLANHFLRFSKKDAIASDPSAIDEATMIELKRRPWSGNVRELRNAIEHAQVLARTGVILPAHLPPARQPDPTDATTDGAPPDDALLLSSVSRRRAEQLLDDPTAFGAVHSRMLGEVERSLLASALERFDNECAPAARALGLHRTTLKRKMDEHRLDGGEPTT